MASEDEDDTESPAALHLTGPSSPFSSSRPAWVRTILWAPVAAIAVVSSKNLFEQSNYHYPFRLLALQEMVALFMLLFQHVALHRASSSWFGLPRSLFHSLQTRLIPCATLLGASLILYMQALLHFPNLVTLLMLTTLLSPLQSLFVALLGSGRTKKGITISTAFAVLFGGLILYDDYRLTVNGLIFGVSALICGSIARALHASGNERVGSLAQSKIYTPWENIVTLALFLNLPFLAILTLILESSEVGLDQISAGPDPKFAFNIVAGAVALALNGSVDVPPEEPEGFPDSTTYDWPSPTCLSLGFARSGTAAWLSTNLCQRGYTSWVQFLAYLLGFSALASGRALPTIARSLSKKPTIENIKMRNGLEYSRLEPPNSRRSSFATNPGSPESVRERQRIDRRLSGLHLVVVSAIILGLISWTTYAHVNFTITPPRTSEAWRPSLDTRYEPPSKFDIVISMYREPTVSISSVISRITRLDSVAKTPPRVFVFTKDEHADTSYVKQALGAFEVVKVPNQGRESETYLRHIVHNWDRLAEHTLFIQADIHNPREFYPRIQDYFKPNTGMLSLGFSGNVCDCLNCGDRWGWSDKSGVLATVYAEANKKSCGPMLLSYKGQFVASAKRIRGVERQVYADLHDALVNPGSWAHQEKYLQGRLDSLNAPYLGYTVERLWSTLLQCSDMDIAWKCPTLLSGTRRGGDAGDCQCFDDVASA